MGYSGAERRKHPRASGRFVVRYRLFEESDNVDITQTKNISMGGMYLTTNKKFESGVKLTLEIRLPFDPHPIMIIGRVLDSREVAKNLIYDTRLEFIAIDEKHAGIITQTVDYYIKKGS